MTPHSSRATAADTHKILPKLKSICISTSNKSNTIGLKLDYYSSLPRLFSVSRRFLQRGEILMPIEGRSFDKY